VSRAESRRAAYIRLLTAAEELGDYVLLQPPHEDGKVTTFEEAIERLRELRSGTDSHFSAYNSAFLEAKLLAGDEVLAILDAFNGWMNTQVVKSFKEADAAETGAFFDIEEETAPLLEAMRREQTADLAA
jgi:hypothetical protein